MPQKLTWLQSIAMAGNGSLWLGGREGVFYSEDHGQNWTEMTTLPISDISGLSYDPDLKRIVVTSWSSSWVLAVNPADRTFKFWDPGWKVRHVQLRGRTPAGGDALQRSRDGAAKDVGEGRRCPEPLDSEGHDSATRFSKAGPGRGCTSSTRSVFRRRSPTPEQNCSIS